MTLRRFAILVVMVLAVVGCSTDSTESTTTTGAPATGGSDSSVGSTLSGTITVSAAASLTEAFGQIGQGFTVANPAARVEFNFDSSSTLSKQIIDGAPADVYASADIVNMTKLTDADLASGEPQAFAANQLVIVTKPGNPDGITGLADLADAGVISLCGEDVPCGKFAKEALGKAGVSIPESRVTRGQNVKAALTAVTEGDAVAAIVYVTDARAAGSRVDTVAIPAAENVTATYPIVVLAASAAPEVAEAFMAYVLSDAGQAVLAELGFLPPA